MRHMIDITPSNARKLIKLQKLFPDLEISADILEIGGDIVVPRFNDPQQAELAKDLIDFNLRSIVAVYNTWDFLKFLPPILYVAKLSGVTDIAFSQPLPVSGMVADAGFQYHKLIDGMEVPSDTLIVTDVTGIPSRFIAYSRMIVISSEIMANLSSLHPKIPNASTILSSRKMFNISDGVSIRDLGVLCSISYALMNHHGLGC